MSYTPEAVRKRFLDKKSVPFFDKRYELDEPEGGYNHEYDWHVIRKWTGATKPSEAIKFMLHALFVHASRDDFVIDSNTFGRIGNRMCFGCMATCVLQEASGIKMVSEDRSILGFLRKVESQSSMSFRERQSIESFVDMIRSSVAECMSGLDSIGVRDLTEDELKRFMSLPVMSSDKWKEQACLYAQFADYLESQGV